MSTNVCICENGSEAVGEECPTDGVALCAVCNPEFELVDDLCVYQNAQIQTVQQGIVNDALIEAGVNNSAKSLAVTLTWENDCDLNLHVWEPSGEEVSDADYDNRESATGGHFFDISPTRDESGEWSLEITRWVKYF